MLRYPCTTALAVWGYACLATAADVELSSVPTQAVYEYQLNYQLPWQRWYGGPGLSLGGTMPTKGVFGYSSLNGVPFPGPLGAGVYANGPGVGPGPNGMGMPLPPPFSPGPTMMPPVASPNLTMMGGMAGPNMGMMGAGLQRPMGPSGPQPGAPSNPPRRHAPVSSPAAKRMSTEQQALGDTKLRQQNWSHAYVNFRNSVDLAPERPEAHFRLALAFTALKQYASAVREFKRSLELDPSLPQSGDKLATILGSDSNVAQTVLIPNVAAWANEDLANPDHLFLLGLILYFADDARGSEILEAALRIAGPAEHILSFLNSDREQGQTAPRRPNRNPAPPTDRGNVAPPIDDALPPSPTPVEGTPYGPFPDPPPT